MSVISVGQFNKVHIETIVDPLPITLGYTVSTSVSGTNIVQQEMEITPSLTVNEFGALTFSSPYFKELFYLYVVVDGNDKNPFLTNRTAVKLEVLSTDTVHQVAVKLNELINMKFNRYFLSTISGDVVTLKCIERGICEEIKDGNDTDYNIFDMNINTVKRVNGYIYVRRDAGIDVIYEKKYVSFITNLADNRMMVGY